MAPNKILQIPRQLPQFDRATLIIVTGRQDAIFYRAWQGLLAQLGAFHLPRPRYSDHEGEFKKRGRGIEISYGANTEIDKRDSIREFLQAFRQQIKRIPEAAEIIIFAPAILKKVIGQALPSAWQKHLKQIIAGNYHRFYPLEILRKLAQAQTRP